MVEMSLTLILLQRYGEQALRAGLLVYKGLLAFLVSYRR